VRLTNAGAAGNRLFGGQLLRHRVFGNESTYRVLATTEWFVDTEVVAAPGLRPGSPVRICRAAARGMLSERSDAGARGRSWLRPRHTRTARWTA
jgi:hypothetical protein